MQFFFGFPNWLRWSYPPWAETAQRYFSCYNVSAQEDGDNQFLRLVTGLEQIPTVHREAGGTYFPAIAPPSEHFCSVRGPPDAYSFLHPTGYGSWECHVAHVFWRVCSHEKAARCNQQYTSRGSPSHGQAYVISGSVQQPHRGYVPSRTDADLYLAFARLVMHPEPKSDPTWGT